MNSDELKRLSKTISRALRHAPWEYELELDDDGWVDIEILLVSLREMRQEWTGILEKDLNAMLLCFEKQRHEIKNGRIRALYGHSLPGKLRKEPATPPEYLYHGTTPKNIDKIRLEGLLPMRRQYVHLSLDRATAFQVGKRKAVEPVILTIKARAAFDSGLSFYRGNDRVWLSECIPGKYIEHAGTF